MEHIFKNVQLADDRARISAQKNSGTKSQQKVVLKPPVVVKTGDSLVGGYKPIVAPFYIPVLDRAMSRQMMEDGTVRMGQGGGDVVYITGDADSYKSTHLQRQAIYALNDGWTVYYFDLDNQFDGKRFLSNEIGKLTAKGLDNFNKSFYLFNNVESFIDLYQQLYSLLNGMMVEAFEYAESNKLSPNRVIYPKHIRPVLIQIDGFSRLISSDGIHKDIDESERTAATNNDIHRLWKSTLGMIKYLQVPVSITGHLRVKGLGGSFAYQGAAYMATMQEYVQYVLQVFTKSGDKKTKNGVEYDYSEQVYYKIKKAKGDIGHTDVIGPVVYVRGHGFDVFHNCLLALEEAGFMPNGTADGKMLEILSTNAIDKIIPKDLEKFVTKEPIKKTEWKKWLQTNNLVADFVFSIINNLHLLESMNIDDRRDFDVDEIVTKQQ